MSQSMGMNQLVAFFLVILAPFVLLIAVGRIRALRRVRRALPIFLEEESLAPAKSRAPGLLLRRFTFAQQLHIHSLRGLAWFGFGTTAYILFVSITLALLPSRTIQWLVVSPKRAAWLSLYSALQASGYIAAVIAVVTGFVSYGTEITPQNSIFYRTRPLSHRFLFFSRTLIALTSLATGIAVGYALALLLVLAVRGPLWLQRTSTEVAPLAMLARTLGVSMVIASLTVMALALERRPKRKRKRFSWIFFPICIFTSTLTQSVLKHSNGSTVLPWSFLSDPNSLRAGLFLPILLISCTAFLFFSSHLFATYEP